MPFFEFNDLLIYATRLVVAAFLGTLLAFHRYPDKYRLSLMESHALLAIAGAMFLIIIGGNFITAVGLLGAASVVRYRYAIEDARDASSLILALGIGMACGIDQLLLATLGTALILVVRQILRHFHEAIPMDALSPRSEMNVKLAVLDYEVLMARLDDVFKKHGVRYSLVSYEKKTRRAGEGVSTEITLHVNMRSDTNLHDLTHELVDDNVERVSWQGI